MKSTLVKVSEVDTYLLSLIKELEWLDFLEERRLLHDRQYQRLVAKLTERLGKIRRWSGLL